MKRVHRGPTGKRVVVAAYCKCGHSRLSWRRAGQARKASVQRCVCGEVLKFGKPRMEHRTAEYRTRKARESKARAARRGSVMPVSVNALPDDSSFGFNPLGFGFLGG